MARAPAPTSHLHEPPHAWSNLSVDFLKAFFSFLGFSLFFFGFIYTQYYYRNFGINAFQIGLSFVDLVAYGLIVLQDPWYLIGGTTILLVAALAWVFRRKMSEGMGLLTALVLLVGLVAVTFIAARWSATDHAREIWGDGKGRQAFCTFNSGDNDFNAVLPRLNEIMSNRDMRFLLLTDKVLYLAPVIRKLPDGQTVGESYAIPAELIRMCRVIGSS